MALKSETQETIRAIADEFGAKKIFIFGSCLEKNEEEAGDIDLGVLGLSKERALAFRHRLYASPMIRRDVDVVRMEDRDWIVPLIELDGEVIYES